MSLRPLKQIVQPKPTVEGAGVRLQRAFGFGRTKEFDPFLLLDDFRNDNPADYVAGFPWHPHRPKLSPCFAMPPIHARF
jgi:redox-sensitive bicupin YhaK (pirin superfamily)